MLGHLFVTLDVTAHAVRYAISFTGAAIGLSLLFAFYTVCQFCFHPLARVPGPHLAAWTSLYKAYYIHFGDISGHTIILHQKYGNVVRIAPNELSFASIESTKVIYGAGSPFVKAPWYQMLKDSKVYLNEETDNLSLFTETNLTKYRGQRRALGPVYSMANHKRHEHHVDDVLEAFMTSMTTTLAGTVIVLDDWVHLYALDALAQLTFGSRPDYVKIGNDGGMLQRSDKFWTRNSINGQWRLTIYLSHFWDYYFPIQPKKGVAPTLFKWAFPLLQKRLSDVSKTSPNFAKTEYSHHPDTAAFNTPSSVPQQVIVPISSNSTEQHASENFDSPRTPPSTPSSSPDILADLLTIHSRHPEWTSTWTTGMTFTNFGAGHDTLTSTLTSILVYICTSPTTLTRVRQELASMITTGTVPDAPTYDTLAENLPYLSACIKEAMRLRPVIGMSLVRVTPASGAVIDGVAVPPGTVVGQNPAVVNRSEDIFGSNANDFVPERWLDEDNETASTVWSRNNLVWGGPSRSCPGQHMARLIMLKFLFVVLRGCRFEVVSKGVDSRGFLARMVDVQARVVVDPVVVDEGKLLSARGGE